MMPARQSLVVLLAAGACGLLGACGQSTASTELGPPVVQQPATGTPSAGQPVIGPPAVRVVRVSVSPRNQLQVSVVGPASSKYRLRLGKDGITCRQTNGRKAMHALPGMPPNSVHPATLSCPGKRAPAGKGALLVTTAMPEGFSYNYEVALDTQLRPPKG